MAKDSKDTPLRFEASKIDGLFGILDAIAWLDAPSTAQLAQFSNLDPRTVGKLLKNAEQIGLIQKVGNGFVLLTSYPYQGSIEQKKDVVKEALVKMPLLVSVRQFISLGDPEESALRKAATLGGIVPFVAGNFAPLMDWARGLSALEANLIAEDLIEIGEATKQERHKTEKSSRVAFLSHSSVDKPFVRQLAADLTSNGVDVWLDEQMIKVGESIPEKISQGLAESDYFLIAISQSSVESEWVKKELNSALVTEVQKRSVHILPLKLDSAKIPGPIQDKKYADFSNSYKAGLNELLAALKADIDD